MNKPILYYKAFVILILFLLVGAGFNSVVGENFENEKDVSSLTFYTFSRTGTKKCKVELKKDIAEDISVMFEDLKNKLTYEPTSDHTFEMRNDFIDLLDEILEECDPIREHDPVFFGYHHYLKIPIDKPGIWKSAVRSLQMKDFLL